jgi:Domain of unknown function (DUF4395)
MSLLTPPARQIDPRGQRFGAGVSAVVLVVALVLGAPWLALLVGLNLALSALLGTRVFLPGRAWPLVRRTLGVGPPTELEHEYPPRFAQALGATALAIATVLAALGATFAGQGLVVAVAALQTILAVTGICIGCRLYFLRWAAPAVFARLFRRADRLVGAPAVPRIQYTGR